MNKRRKWMILLVLIVIGAGAGYYMWSNANAKSKELEELRGKNETAPWNAYAEDEHHLHTLSDFLVSANQGEQVVKMTLTLDFKDDEAYIRFLGHASKEEGEKAMKDSGGHGDDEGHLTPMEIAINDAVGQLMMAADEDVIRDKTKLKGYLMEQIPKTLGLKDNPFHGMYIENYVVQ